VTDDSFREIAIRKLGSYRLPDGVENGLFQGNQQVGPVVQIFAPFDCSFDIGSERGWRDGVRHSDLSR
jgi:hypothetical protein